MQSKLAYLYQLQNVDYPMLSSTNFKVAVVDPDSSELTATQIANLSSSGKNLLSYLSIGAAEPWRNYWNPNASYLIEKDQIWKSYYVKFWDPQWQQIIIDKAKAIAQAGYKGIVMDLVNAYDINSVAGAHNSSLSARNDMMKFIATISNITKAINPNFKIIQNNGLDLLVTDPTNPKSASNQAHIAKIDGVNAESTFYLSNNTATTWEASNLEYLKHAKDNGKVVFGIDYPTNTNTQQAFINKSVQNGFIPFVGNPGLNQTALINYQILDQLPAYAFDFITSNSSISTPTPTITPGTIPIPRPTTPHPTPMVSGGEKLSPFGFYNYFPPIASLSSLPSAVIQGLLGSGQYEQVNSEPYQPAPQVDWRVWSLGVALSVGVVGIAAYQINKHFLSKESALHPDLNISLQNNTGKQKESQQPEPYVTRITKEKEKSSEQIKSCDSCDISDNDMATHYVNMKTQRSAGMHRY
jgi:uncharacterized protein (TIGR01370 family)